MKRLFSGILITYILIRLIASCATKVPPESVSNIASDTAIPKDNIPVKIDTFQLDLLPPSVGVQFYRNGIVFLSISKNEEKMLPGHLSFGTVQAYYSEVKDTITGKHIAFSPSASFPYPTEALSFTSDFNTMYFTKISESDKKEKIYHAKSDNQKGWVMDSEPLGFCTTGFNYSHPAVSADGNTMIFASDNPGSLGRMDLFITRKINEKWSEPKNLGIAINTEGNELFPSLDADNNLFFSSDGHSGSGGYDIFMSKAEANGWGITLNLTRHINTTKDEVAFTTDRITRTQAFFSTRQKSRNNEMQLYRVSLNKGILTNDANLSKVLYSLALSEVDSTDVKKIMGKLEAERARIEKIKSDSIDAARTDAERAKIARMKAENTEKARIEAERFRIAKARTDSLAAAKLNAKKFQTDKVKAAKMRADSLATAKFNAQKLEAERVKAAERIDADRIRIAQIKADSIMAAKKESEKLEARRIKAERLRLDSLEALRLEADRKANPDIITYKVQFLSTTTKKDKFFITVDGVVYNANEYFYLKEYRYTVGEFSTLEPAKYLQYGCRRSGYPQAFVVAFKNGKRSLDMGLFK